MTKDNQPDWQAIAEKFDLWLPYIKPVGDELLIALNAQPGDRILDVASGTGEPALTLARNMGNAIDIIGIDAAEGMIDVAQGKVKNDQLDYIRFLTMPVELMSFHEQQFDKVMCRFGVMLFDDPLAGVKEMYRVLKPNGSFSLAVWSTAESMLTMYWMYLALKDKLPESLHPPIKKVASLGEPGAVEALLKEGGFTDFHVEKKTFHYEFSSFNDYWETIEASDIMKMQFDALTEAQCLSVKNEMAMFATKYEKNDGFKVPHEYLLVTGKR